MKQKVTYLIFKKVIYEKACALRPYLHNLEDNFPQRNVF